MSSSTNKIGYINNVFTSTKNNINKTLGIGQKIYDIVNNEYNQIISIVLIALLILAIIILYRKSFSYQKELTLSNINIPKRKLKTLPICNQISKDEQYRLCDYYICSSYNTQCVGEQHFDYVSEDMYKSALLNGIRYIELPIFSDGVDEDSEPVIATGYDGKFTITSLNTVPFEKVVSTIKNYAFKYYNEENPETFKNINYPLIINLKIHTDNENVLIKANDILVKFFNKLLLSSEKYKKYPIQFEKLCQLTNKIILITRNDNYENIFKNILIPSRNFLNNFNINYISKYILDTSTANDYYKNLSLLQNQKKFQNMKELNIILKDLLDNGKNSNIFTILNNPNINTNELLNNLMIFNMLGITIIDYDNESKSSSSNIDFRLLIRLGCQIIPMNFQTNDNIILNYINLFKDSSFKLKPSSIRLPIIEQELINSLDKYDSSAIDKINLPIISDFVYKNNFSYITLHEVSTDYNKILTNNNQINFKNYTTNKNNSNNKININDKNLLYIKTSPLSKLNDLIMLIFRPSINNNQSNKLNQSKQNFELALTVIDSEISLAPIEPKSYKYQSFYPLTGFFNDNLKINELITKYYKDENLKSGKINNDYGMISLATYDSVIKSDTNNYKFLTMEQNQLKTQTFNLSNVKSDDTKRMSFFFTNIKIKETIKLFNSSYGYLKLNTNKNILGMFKNINHSQATSLLIERFDVNKFMALNTEELNNFKLEELKLNKLNNDGLITRLVVIKTLNPNGYFLYCSQNKNLLLKRSFNKDCIFLLSKNFDNQYKIINELGGTLQINNNGLLNFNTNININDDTTIFSVINNTELDL
jgi:hypothetical protein